MPTNNYSKNIVYLSKEQYQELITNETLTVNGLTITYNDNDIYVTPLAEPITDVKINGTSIGNNGVANIPIADGTNAGVIKISNGTYGVYVHSTSKLLIVNRAIDNDIKSGANQYSPIVPYNLHISIFYGLAKASGDTTLSQSSNTIGIYTNNAKQAIQNMLGITDLISTEESSTATTAHVLNSTFMMDGKLHRATAAIAIGDAVEVGTNCEVVKADEIFIKNTDYATENTYGLVKVNSNYGIAYFSNNDKTLTLVPATSSLIKAGINSVKPLVPYNQHQSVFFGLSKVAGVDLANETVTLGTYPETSKTAIRSLIGAGTPLDVQINGTSIVSSGVANIPIADYGQPGAFNTESGMGFGYDTVGGVKTYKVSQATSEIIKAGTNFYRPITPQKQHEAVFYGLATAAGDSTLSVSSNIVGTYTSDASAAIRAMLGAGAPLDVQINETSIVNNGVANVPVASSDVFGVVKIGSNMQISSNGVINFRSVGASEVKAGTTYQRALTPERQHASVFYGLTKAAGVDMASSSNAIGVYTDAAKDAIQNMLGISDLIATKESSTAITAHTINSIFLMDGKLYKATSAIAVGDAVEAGTNCLVVKADEVFIKNTDIASTSTAGIVKIGNGLEMQSSTNKIQLLIASASLIKVGAQLYGYALVPYYQHTAVFYGLSKAAGVDLASETVTFGTYPETSKTAIRSLIGAAAASDLSNKEDKTVVVIITSTQNQGITTYIADKTFAEIGAAIEAGKTVIATTEYYGWHTYYKLTDYGVSTDLPEDSFIRFSREDGQDSTRIRINYDNTINYEATVLSTFYGISINGTEIYPNDGISNIPAASTDTFGVVKIGNGLGINSSNGKLQVNSSSSGNVKIGTDGYAPIVPGHQHESVFYGLSKAAGVDLANETVTLGTYPETSKAAIRSLIGAGTPLDVLIIGTSIVSSGIANFPLASTTTYGILKMSTNEMVKAGNDYYSALTPFRQHLSTFYGLAKAAGDTTLVSSNNEVGTYTNDAKTAIQIMLGTQAAIEVIRL